MNLPPFIGSAIGFFVGGYLNDKSIMWLANKNQGIYEPEQRLWMAIPTSITIPVGLLTFGIGLAQVRKTRERLHQLTFSRVVIGYFLRLAVLYSDLASLSFWILL